MKDRVLIYLSLAVSIGALGYAAWVHQHSGQMTKQALRRLDDEREERVTLLAPTLPSLQGTWEGVESGHESNGKITITITGNSLHFHPASNAWYETTFTLPAGTDPKQLRATIKRSSYADHTGKVVFALFKIEDGVLTLAADAGSGKPPDGFEEEKASIYKLRRVQPQ